MKTSEVSIPRKSVKEIEVTQGVYIVYKDIN